MTFYLITFSQDLSWTIELLQAGPRNAILFPVWQEIYLVSRMSGLVPPDLLYPPFLSNTVELNGVRGGAVGWGTALQAERSRVPFPMELLELFQWLNPSRRIVALG